MPDTTYNGWSNYETWRVNLEILGDIEFDNGENFATVYDLSKYLEEYTDDIVTAGYDPIPSLAIDYARSFLSDVNYYEIAEHFADVPGLIGEWQTCDDCGEKFKEGTEDFDAINGDHAHFLNSEGYCLTCAARND